MMAKKAPAWSREFDVMVRAIGECKSKAEEDAIIVREVEVLKPRLKDAKLDKRLLKEMLVRLIYVEMLGHDASWGHVKALQACSETHLLTKKVAYLASSLFLDHKSDLLILVVNTITQDLKSDNYLVVCTALTAVCKLIGPDLINAVLPAVTELCTHPKELVRKKAVMALHRFEQLDPTHDSSLHNMDLAKYFRQALCDKDPSVMSASLCALLEVAACNAAPYKNLIPSFVSILKQVAEHRLPKAFDYHKSPAPFIQVKLLRLLALLGAGDKAGSDNMYAVVGDVMRRANTGHTIGNAIVYECVRTITAIYPNPVLLQSAAETIAAFLKSSSHNLKYVGIDALSRVVRINAKYAAEHQLAVIDCLEDPDDTLKKKTLELLFKMTKPANVETQAESAIQQVIVEKMIDYLRGCTDDVQKADVVKRLGELAERFAPDTQWFIDTMNQVFELGGDVVDAGLADNLMRLIAEGAGEEDEAADAELRSQAVASYLALLQKPKLPDILLKVICWVLGEYGTVAGSSPTKIIDQLCSIADSQALSDDVRGFLLAAIGKLAAQSSGGLPLAAQDLLHWAAASANLDLQQRALEIQALSSEPAAFRQVVLPFDASCEDLDIDANLPFLNNFVQGALANGAAPYLSDQERLTMGMVRPSHHEEALDHSSHALRFAAYETSAPPQQAVTTLVPSRDASPLKDFGGVSGLITEDAPARSGPPAGGEPQLALKPSSRGRWGPAGMAPPVSAPTQPPKPAFSGAGLLGRSDVSSAPRERTTAPEPEVPSGKAKLAGLLFGDAATSSSRARPTRPPSAAKKASPGQSEMPAAPAVAAAPDLLSILDDTPQASQPAIAPSQPSDPFAMLEGLSHPAEAPPPAPAAAATKPALDLDALYASAPPSASTSAGMLPMQPGFGGGGLFGSGPNQPASGGLDLLGGFSSVPVVATDHANGLYGGSASSAAIGRSSQSSGGKGAPLSGKGPVIGQSAKKDPFADLMS